jgi:hypothetical protein
MDHAVPIALKIVAVTMRELRVAASPGTAHRESEEGERLGVHENY